MQEQSPIPVPIGRQASSGDGVMVNTLAAMHHHNVQLQHGLLGLARETGRLEQQRDVERSEKVAQANRADFYKAETARLRNERDDERSSMASLQRQYDAAKASLHSKQLAVSDISSSYENISSPLLGDFGDMISSVESLDPSDGMVNKYVHPLGASWLEDNRSSSDLSMIGSTHSLGSFLQPYYHTATEIYTHLTPPVFTIEKTKLYLNGLFIGSETWGGVYAILPVSAMPTTIQKLGENLMRMSKVTHFDQVNELLEVLVSSSDNIFHDG